MRPEVEAYLRDHGSRYTTKALRVQLIHAGYDPAEVDAALLETEQTRKPQLAETQALRSRFWALALLINLSVLVGVTVRATQYTSLAGAVFLVLGIVLLVGLGISGSIGRSLLPRTGLLIALVAPALVALLLGGFCLAMTSTGTPLPTTRSGTMEIRFDPPVDFTGSGPATCESYSDYAGHVIVSAYDLGSIGDRPVRVTIGSAGDPNASDRSPDEAQGISLEIDIFDEVTGSGAIYFPGADPPTLTHAAANGLSGTIAFERVLKAPSEPGVIPGPDSLSGTLSWTCD